MEQLEIIHLLELINYLQIIVLMLGKRQMKKAGSKYKQKSIECFDLRDFESESIIKILLNTFILVLTS
ncbi:hypothetical protein C0103_12130 [Staphylococcus aureus]|nr:hypothetical protein C0103_12130 [Staphylococcus aureus]